MRLSTRTFLWSFFPFALLLMGSFWAIQKLTVLSARNELRSSLRQAQVSMARAGTRSEMQNRRFLKLVADNAPLKAGVRLMLTEAEGADARRTVEDQLREICDTLKFDFLLVSGPESKPLAGVMRSGGQLAVMDMARVKPPARGFFTVGGLTYRVNSVALDQDDENIGTLTLGEQFDFAGFSMPVALTRNGRVLHASVPGISSAELEAALAKCGAQPDCEFRLAGQAYLCLPMDGIYFGDGYSLRSLQNIDAATAPLQSILREVFFVASLGALAAALLISIVSSRSIVQPIATLVSHLRGSAATGLLPQVSDSRTHIVEIGELTNAFNRAAEAIRAGEENLHRAYFQFVRSLASALDARDPYTAGHSLRVSEHSCAIAEAMLLPETELDEIRIGALLHDIGKIGIGDNVLQKTDKLTADEYALVQRHPTIGRHILEGVHGFQRYLAIVELHHENWDGTGYPHGLIREKVPLSARIVHVADAYDAMTTDRPYRRGMSHGEAVRVLESFAGSQFDPKIVEVFCALDEISSRERQAGPESSASLVNLANAVAMPSAAQIEQGRVT